MVSDVLTFGVDYHFVYQSDFLKFVERLVGKPYGDLALFRNGFCRIGSFSFFKPFGDVGHDEHGYKVAVTPADAARVLIETEIADVLSGIRQLGTEQTDGPRNLEP